nr:MAG TPA: hypothetical protein [Caudoviricetes sp.]
MLGTLIVTRCMDWDHAGHWRALSSQPTNGGGW